MTKDEALKLALNALENNRQTHHYCEDTWYSCPKHEDGCANEAEGDECNCGADKANAEIDCAITAIKEALAQPEQNLNCKSVQARLATAWGYVKAEQEPVGTVGDMFDERVISKRELDRDSLVYIAQPKENT